MSKATLRVAETLIAVNGRAHGAGSSFYATDDELKRAKLAPGAYRDGVEKNARTATPGGETLAPAAVEASTVAPRAAAKRTTTAKGARGGRASKAAAGGAGSSAEAEAGTGSGDSSDA